MTCPHGFKAAASCTACMYEDGLPAPRPEPETVAYVFTSKYDGQCPACDLPIRQGQRIVRTSRDRYLHLDCRP